MLLSLSLTYLKFQFLLFLYLMVKKIWIYLVILMIAVVEVIWINFKWQLIPGKNIFIWLRLLSKPKGLKICLMLWIRLLLLMLTWLLRKETSFLLHTKIPLAHEGLHGELFLLLKRKNNRRDQRILVFLEDTKLKLKVSLIDIAMKFLIWLITNLLSRHHLLKPKFSTSKWKETITDISLNTLVELNITKLEIMPIRHIKVPQKKLKKISKPPIQSDSDLL